MESLQSPPRYAAVRTILVASLLSLGLVSCDEPTAPEDAGTVTPRSDSGTLVWDSGPTVLRDSGMSLPDAGNGGVRDDTDYGVRFADWAIANWNLETYGFYYFNGIVVRGVQRIYELTGDARYLAYVQGFADSHIGPDGTELMLATPFNIDRIMPATCFNFLYAETGQARFLTAADQIRAAYDTFPRNPDGGLWHKGWLNNEMWADTAYMSMPFLAEYSEVTDCGTYCVDQILLTILLYAEHAQLPSGLVRHGWDWDADAAWADSETGLAPIVWSRGLGWYTMAIVDSLVGVPEDHPRRGELLTVLRDLAAGVADAQDPDTGLWFHVVDQPERAGNWIEHSGSLFLIYALKKAADLGYIDASYADVARTGWEAIKLRIDANSTETMPWIGQVVVGTDIQVSYEGYIGRPTEVNGPHGLLAVMLAASQFESY